jgi:hypothetical protein
VSSSDSTGQVRVQRLYPNAMLAFSNVPERFDAKVFHHLEAAAHGETLEVALDGNPVTFDADGIRGTALPIPPVWQTVSPKCNNGGSAGRSGDAVASAPLKKRLSPASAVVQNGVMRKIALVPWLLLLANCSQPVKTEKAAEPAAPPEAIAGREAFYKTYPQARTWATDATPLQVKSIDLKQVKSGAGKAGAWQVIYVSPLRGKSRMFTYSAVEAEGNLHQGVFANLEESYSASHQSTPFAVQALKIDTDAAWETAVKNSADYMKTHPDGPITYVLELTNRYPNVAWRIIWGESVSASDYSVFVDATTGVFLGKVRG